MHVFYCNENQDGKGKEGVNDIRKREFKIQTPNELNLKISVRKLENKISNKVYLSNTMSYRSKIQSEKYQLRTQKL